MLSNIAIKIDKKIFEEKIAKTHRVIKIKLPISKKDFVISIPKEACYPLNSDIISDIYENFPYTLDSNDPCDNITKYNVVEIILQKCMKAYIALDEGPYLNRNICVSDGLYFAYTEDCAAVLASLAKI